MACSDTTASIPWDLHHLFFKKQGRNQMCWGGLCVCVRLRRWSSFLCSRPKALEQFTFRHQDLSISGWF